MNRGYVQALHDDGSSPAGSQSSGPFTPPRFSSTGLHDDELSPDALASLVAERAARSSRETLHAHRQRAKAEGIAERAAQFQRESDAARREWLAETARLKDAERRERLAAACIDPATIARRCKPSVEWECGEMLLHDRMQVPDLEDMLE